MIGRKLVVVLAVVLSLPLKAGTPVDFGLKGGFELTEMNFSASDLREANRAGFYLGPDADKLGALDALAVSERNSGLTPHLANMVFLPYSLSADEAYALGNWGYRYVMRHASYADESPLARYSKGDDGAFLPDDAGIGLDPNRSACIPRAITNGMVVAAICYMAGHYLCKK